MKRTYENRNSIAVLHRDIGFNVVSHITDKVIIGIICDHNLYNLKTTITKI